MKPPPLPPPKIPPGHESRQQDPQAIIVWVLGAMIIAILLLLLLIALVVHRDEIGGSKLGKQDSPVESIGELNSQHSNSTMSSESGTQQSEVASSEGGPSSTSADKPEPSKQNDSASSSSTPPEAAAGKSEQIEGVSPRAIQIFDGSGAPALPIGASSSGGANPFLGDRDAKQVVFVIDKSGSMAGGALERVIAALIEAIEALSETQEFQVIFFESSAMLHPSLHGLVVANQSNKSSYSSWISKMRASGGTEPVEAVTAGLSANPERLVILSDGEFNPLYVDQITKFNRKNNTKKVTRIDCVGLVEQVESLKQIAQQNGPGIYYQAK
jgi:Mg-chelatase subunit ChlD